MFIIKFSSLSKKMQNKKIQNKNKNFVDIFHFPKILIIALVILRFYIGISIISIEKKNVKILFFITF